MDPFRNPPADTLAAARLHVQALTECGLPREALLRALLEDYCAEDAGSTTNNGLQTQAAQQSQRGQQVGQGRVEGSNSKTRLSVSTTSSKSSGRSSVLSTTTTMSSVSSHAGTLGGGGGGGRPQEAAVPPPPPPPPAPPAKTSNRGVSKPPGTYWCTFCNVDFQRKFDWKRHEDEFHERYKRYPCPKCNRIFWGANTFNQHHKDAHGCTTCSHAIHVVRYTKRKRAWACGFCGGFLSSRDRYFDHVARHYEDGCNKSHWNHSLVIYGLLHQPLIIREWKALVAALYGHLPRNQQPMFEWDPKTTGHAQGFFEGESPGNLQDLLEFFTEGRDDPKFLARLAHDLAIIRFRHELKQAAARKPSNTRPVSEPPKPKPALKISSSAKHRSTPQPPLPPPPPYGDQPAPTRHRNIASTPSQSSNMSVFSQAHPQPQPPGGEASQFASTIMGTQEIEQTGAFYDLTVTHIYPHMQHIAGVDQEQKQQQQQQQQQQHVLVPTDAYEDWSSLAGTVVDESVFASAMALGWTDIRGASPETGR